MNTRKTLLTLFFALFLGQIMAGVLFVKQDATGNADGSNWTDAYTDLQTAIGVATPNDSIIVAQGVYKPHDTDQSVSFALTDSVYLYGSFEGTEDISVFDFTQRKFTTHATILSGDLLEDDEDNFVNIVDNSTRVVTASSLNTAVLDGFSITGGNIPSGSGQGAGISCVMSNLTIQNCAVFANWAYWRGGGVSLINCDTVSIINTSIMNNYSATFNGAGINSEGTHAFCVNTILWDNYKKTTPNQIDATVDSAYYFKNSLVQNTGGSENWTVFRTVDLGGNIDVNPYFTDGWASAEVLDVSSVIQMGDPMYGANIGQYQEAGAELVYKELYVDDDAPAGGDGSSWTTAFYSLSDALASAKNFTNIYVAAGTYIPDSTSMLISFTMKSTVAVYGGFVGTETPIDKDVLANRDFATNTSILSGDLQADDDGFTNNIENSQHVVVAVGTDTSTVLDGFTITGGNAASNSEGGGLYFSGAGMKCANLTVTNCTAEREGGGVYMEASDVSFTNLTVQDCYAIRDGGAICSETSTLVIDNIRLTGNNTDRYGGALYVNGGSADITGLYATGNNSGMTVGGLYLTRSKSSITNATIANNLGSGLYLYIDSTDFVNTIVYGNEKNNSATLGGSSFSHCLIQGTGGSEAWNFNYTIDNGNNYDSDPKFVDIANDNDSLYTNSPAYGMGDQMYGTNIGYFQGEGVPVATIRTTESALTFESTILMDVSDEVMFDLTGEFLEKDITIVAPEGILLSLSSGDYTGKTDTITVAQTDGNASATVYAVFQPTEPQQQLGDIKLFSGLSDTVLVSASGEVRIPDVQPSLTILMFDDLPVTDTSFAQFISVEGFNISDSIYVTAPNGFDISLTQDFDGRTDYIAIPAVNDTVENTNIFVRFAPMEVNNFEETIVISATGISDKTVTLYGNSLQPELYLGDNIDFGNVQVETFSEPYVLDVYGYALAGDVILYPSDHFQVSYAGGESFVSEDSLIISKNAAMYEDAIVYVRFYAETVELYSEQLMAVTDFIQPTSIPVSGTGVMPSPEMEISLTSLAFDDTDINTVSLAQVVTITGMYLTDDVTITAPESFEVSTDGVTFTSSVTITPVDGAVNSDVSVRFAPGVDVAIYSGDVTYMSTGVFPLATAVTGYAIDPSQPNISISNNNILFDKVLVGETAEQSFTFSADMVTDDVMLTTDGSFGISLTSGDVSSAQKVLVISPDQGIISETTVYVYFTPEATVFDTYTLMLTSTGAITRVISLSGTGYKEPSVDVGVTELDFGNLISGSVSGELSFSVEAENLISNIKVQAPNGYYISQSSGADFNNGILVNLVPVEGAVSTTIYAKFAPSTVGNYDNSGTVSGDDINPIQIQFKGTAIAKPSRFYVNDDAMGSQSGLSWANAFIDLQEAISIATSGDTILVAKGVYTPGDTRKSSFIIKEGIKLYGGFMGNEDMVMAPLTQRDPAKNETILSGDINRDDISAGDKTNNAFHVVQFNGATKSIYASTVLDGFTIANGYADGEDFNNFETYGAGIFINAGSNAKEASPTLKNLKVINNYASLFGGGLTCYPFSNDGEVNPVIENTVFMFNESGQHGGAIYIAGTVGNSAPQFTNTLITDNIASGGAAIYTRGSCGGVAAPVFNGLTVCHNTASFGAPIENIATDEGGSCENVGGTCTPTFINATITQNTSDYAVDGMRNTADMGTCSVTLINTILSGNGLATDAQIENATGATADISYSLIQNSGGSSAWVATTGTDGGNNLDTAPEFIDPANCDLRLSITSAAILAGDKNHGDNIGAYQESGLDNPPLITVTTTPIQFGDVSVGTRSIEKSFTVSAKNLTEDLVLTTAEPFNLSLTSGSAYSETVTISSDGGVVNDVTVYVTLLPDTNMVYNGEIMLSSTGALAKTITVSGSGSFYDPYTYVDINAKGANDGSSWADAYTSLQTALVTSSSGDMIVVAKGTYTPHASDRMASFNLVEGVKLYGGFAGTEFPITQETLTNRDFFTNETILSGDLSGDDNSGGSNAENSYHVVVANGENRSITASTELNGFTISGGNADGDWPHITGGGIEVNAGGYQQTSSPTLTNLVLKDNYASTYGGALYVFPYTNLGVASPAVSNCVFENNTSGYSGGAVYNIGGVGLCAPTFDNVIFRNNSATQGGAVSNVAYCDGNSNPVFTNAFFCGNSANDGRDVYNHSTDAGGSCDGNGGFVNAQFINTTFIGNKSFGASVYSLQSLETCTVTFTNTIIWNTIEGYTGTGVSNGGNPAVTFTNSIVQNSGGSSAWDVLLGTDGGNNLASDPQFLYAQGCDFRLIETSPAIGAGQTANGVNIGYYQESGELAPVLEMPTISEITFDDTEIGVESVEQELVLNGVNLQGGVSITVPDGFVVSMYSGADFDAQQSLQLDGDMVSNTTSVFVRFVPQMGGTTDGELILSYGDTQYTVTLSGYSSSNEKPIIETIAEIYACGGESLAHTPLYITDEDPTSLTITFRSTNQLVLQDESMVLDEENGIPVINYGGLGNVSDYTEIWVIVEDAQGAIDSTMFLITTTQAPIVEAQVIQDITCPYEYNGEIEVMVSNATGFVSMYDMNGYMVDGYQYNLGAGDYQYYAMDENNCAGYSNTVTLSEPSPIMMDSMYTTPASPFNEGEATVYLSGGTPPYTYWVNGEYYDYMPFMLGYGQYGLEVEDMNGCRSDYMNITIDWTDEVSADEVSSVAVDVFPVPVTDVLQVKASEVIKSISLKTLTGSAIIEISQIGTSDLTIPVKSLPAGMYILEVKAQTGVSVQEIVKE